MSNFIFLDMDGVLNSNNLIDEWFTTKEKELEHLIEDNVERYKAVKQAFSKEFVHSTELVMPELAARFTKLVTDVNANIIWSSTWRILDKYAKWETAKEMFNRRGLPGDRLIGYTPNFNYFRMPFNELRVREINSVIHNKQFGINKKSKIVIIDDLDLSALDNSKNIRFFQTNIKEGLTETISDKIKTFLLGD